MSAAERQYLEAIKTMNVMAYAALRAASDTEAMPMINRQLLRNIARGTDALVDAGLETAVQS